MHPTKRKSLINVIDDIGIYDVSASNNDSKFDSLGNIVVRFRLDTLIPTSV